MTAHVHAALMAEYAKDAAEMENPSSLWEVRYSNDDEWKPYAPGFPSLAPSWDPKFQYRRKPRTIRIGEFDVPEPMREAPALRSRYFATNLCGNETVDDLPWNGDEWDKKYLSRGICHSTREAAELHAKALISLTERK